MVRPVGDKAKLEKEIAYLKERLATIDDRWKGAVVTSIWAGSTYNHARYFRQLERQSLYSKLKRREQKLRRILRNERQPTVREN